MQTITKHRELRITPTTSINAIPESPFHRISRRNILAAYFIKHRNDIISSFIREAFDAENRHYLVVCPSVVAQEDEFGRICAGFGAEGVEVVAEAI